MAYITKAQVKTFYGITTSTLDTEIDTLIANVSKMIEEKTGMIFEAAADSTRYYNPETDTDGYKLLFDCWFASITSVTNGDGVAISPNDYIKLPADAPHYGIQIKSEAGIYWDYTTNPENAITVVGKAAYSTSCPVDLQQVIIRWVWYLMQTKKENTDKLPFWVSETIERYAAKKLFIGAA